MHVCPNLKSKYWIRFGTVPSGSVSLTNSVTNLAQKTDLNDHLIFCNESDKPFYVDSTGNATTISTNIGTVRNFANASFDLANTNASAITVIQSVDNTQNTNISIIQDVDVTQNTNIQTATNLAQAAYDYANTVSQNAVTVSVGTALAFSIALG